MLLEKSREIASEEMYTLVLRTALGTLSLLRVTCLHENINNSSF